MGSSDRTGRRTLTLLTIVLLIAAAIRIWYLWEYSLLDDWYHLTVDNWYHHNWAQVMAAGDWLGSETYFRAPFYVICLGVIYTIFGASIWAARIFGLAIGLTSVAMTFLIGKRVGGTRIGASAALIQSVYPVMVYFETELLLDPLFTLLMQLGLWLWLIWLERPRGTTVFMAGLALGMAAITRPTALIVVALLLVWTLVRAGRSGSGLRNALLLMVGLTVAIGPVTVRNLAQGGEPVLIASQGGINFYIGNHEGSDGISPTLPEPLGTNWRIRQITDMAERDRGTELRPGEVSGWWADQALAWIRANPVRAGRHYLQKVYHSLSNQEISNNRHLGQFWQRISVLRLNPLSFAIILAFAAIGAIALRARAPGALVLVAVVAVYLAGVALFFFSSRFRLPILPYLFILAAAGATTTLRRLLDHPLRGLGRLGLAGLIWLFSWLPIVSLPAGSSCTGLMSKGLFYYSIGEHRAALGQFEAAQAIDSDFPEVNLNKAATYLRLGRADSARIALDREQLAHPGRHRVYSNLASWHLLHGHHDSALAACHQALGLASWDVTANRLRMRIAAGGESAADSLKAAAEAALEATRYDLTVASEAALLLTEQGCNTAAIRVLKAAISTSPPPVETDDGAFEPDFPNHPARRQKAMAQLEYQLGYLFGLSRDFGQAVHHTQLAIEQDSSLAAAYINLISGLMAQQQLDQAGQVIREAKRRFPKNSLIQQIARDFPF